MLIRNRTNNTDEAANSREMVVNVIYQSYQPHEQERNTDNTVEQEACLYAQQFNNNDIANRQQNISVYDFAEDLSDPKHAL